METTGLFQDNTSVTSLTSGYEQIEEIVKEKEELLHHLNDEFAAALRPVSKFIGIEIILGFFGNLSVLYVFIFRYHACNFRYFVIYLSFNDLVGSLTVMPGEIVGHVYWYMYPSRVLCKIKSYFNLFTVFCEAWILVFIAVDRYRKVSRPLGWQIKPLLTKVLCGCIFLIAFLVSLPLLVLWGTQTIEKRYMNETVKVTICEKDEKVVNTESPNIFTRFVQAILLTPVSIMILLYALILYHIIKQHRVGRKINGTPVPAKESKTTEENKEKVGFKLHEETLSETVMDFDLIDQSTETSFSSKDITKSTDEIENGLPKDSKTDENIKAADLLSSSASAPEKHDKQYMPESSFACTATTSQAKKGKRGHGNAKRKTKIMFILIFVFFITTTIYMVLIEYISRQGGILEKMTNSERAVYFFFLRLVYINHVINPFVYGMLDTKYKAIMFAYVGRFRKWKY